MCPEHPDGEVLPVLRSRDEARRFYDRISGIYDLLTGGAEARPSERALEMLSTKNGERMLEIGPGTGRCLERIARASEGGAPHVGIDISSGMLRKSMGRLNEAGLGDRVELCCCDALSLPIRVGAFDLAFMSFTLELFDTSEIPSVLGEVRRVLRPGGRLGNASLSKKSGDPIALRMYEWAHTRWPRYFDCRPIYAVQSLIDAGFNIVAAEDASMFGLPLELTVATSDRPQSLIRPSATNLKICTNT